MNIYFKFSLSSLAVISSLFVLGMLHADIDTNRMLFLLHRGELNNAIELYQSAIKSKRHDHDVIEQACLMILEQGFHSGDPEIQFMTIFGASVAANEKALHIIEEAVRSPVPAIQLAALNLLTRCQHEGFEDSLRYMLRSPILPLRLEALFLLAENKDPKTAAYAESLMAIVDDVFIPVFPEIFAAAGDGASTQVLKKLISHPREDVRIATILTLAKHQRDDFLPKIRTLATHHSLRQLEGCAYALGMLKDQTAIPILQQLATSQHVNIKIAALHSLYRLGKKEARRQIESLALNEDLVAIAALKEIAETEDTLTMLMKSNNPNARINATLGLLEKKDIRCLTGVTEILLRDTRDYAFARTSSKGRSATYWKVIPSAQQKVEDFPGLEEQTIALRSSALIASLELEEKFFLQIADALLNCRQNDLVPLVVSLLENKATPESIALLKKYQQKAGAPFIRHHCNLALYRLKEQGPYENLLKEWILGHMSEPLFHFKGLENAGAREFSSSFKLTPDETSKLLIESIEAIAHAQNELSIDILLEIIKRGHPKNKYILAGLLIRVIQ